MVVHTSCCLHVTSESGQRFGTVQAPFFSLLCLFMGVRVNFGRRQRFARTQGNFFVLCLFIGLIASFDSGQRFRTRQRPFLGLLCLYVLPVGVCQT